MSDVNLTLPTDSAERKNVPVFAGFLAYFPAAVALVSRWSKLGNDKHNPGQPLHHSRGKSADHDDCIIRHTMDLADARAALERREAEARDGVAEAAHHKYQAYREAHIKVLLDEATARAWRAMAALQELAEEYQEAPLAPGARAAEREPGHGPEWPKLTPGDAPLFVSSRPRSYSGITQPTYTDMRDAACAPLGKGDAE